MTRGKNSDSGGKKPLLVYDGECRFCVRCVERLKLSTEGSVDYVPFQDQEKCPANVSQEDYSQAVHLFVPGKEKPFRGAEAMCRVWASGNKPSPLPLFLYEKSSLFARCAEGLYRFVAKHRSAMSAFTSILWGKTLLPSTHSFSSWLFGRGLGLVALVAFISYWVQAEGLVGPEGIVPFDQQLEDTEKIAEQNAELPAKEWLRPTLLWASPTWDMMEILFCIGIACSLLLVAGAIPAIAAAGIGACYLSVMVVGEPFLSFQWDALLLETCLLSIFFLPWKTFTGPRSTPPPSRLGHFLIALLLFKLMFESGVVKFTWFGAENANAWSDLTALDYHYWTQPIPSWTSWHFDRLPDFLNQSSLWFMYAVELILPFFFFLPRNAKRLAFCGQVALQALIMASGNYGFFNFLSIVLCLPLLDDQALPARLKTWLPDPRKKVTGERRWAKRLKLAGATPLTILFILSGWIYLERDFAGNRPPPEAEEPSPWRESILRMARQTRAINSYGLFRVMTTTRPELIIEASMDGESWEPYVFKWKPGEPQRPPEFFIPHMPRLDWQMWFEALNAERYAGNPLSHFLYGRFLSVMANGGTRENFMDVQAVIGPQGISELRRMNSAQRQRFFQNYDAIVYGFLQRSNWFAQFLERLTQAKPVVLELMGEAPFGEEKPRFLRVSLWRYSFASPEEKERGRWWNREKVEAFDIIIESKRTP